MLTIEVEFLMGRATISEWEDRSQAEWPPHPQRLFSALVAAHGELDGGANTERALKWLEALPAPEIKADPLPSTRTSPSYFVPVNDEVIKLEKGRADLRHVLDRRNRQERFFPSVIPADPVVSYQWPDVVGLEEHQESLKLLIENLTYIGHSSSPVRGCIREKSVSPSLIPMEGGSRLLRVPGVGRFDRLASVHVLRQKDESVQPPLGRFQPYEQPGLIASSLFSADAIVVSFGGGPKIGLDSTLPLMQHLRNALLAKLGASPEVLSGHDAAGKMSMVPHLAVLPMPFVGSRYADGSVKGAAFVLPSTADDAVRRRLRAALMSRWQLHLGPLGALAVSPVDASFSEQLKSVDFSLYTRTARTWASVTPVVLDRHPKKNGLNAEEVISSACERAGLPPPAEVREGLMSAITGVPPAAEFHGRSKQVDNRLRRHVLLRFDSPVRGPILLGAGRFLGLGMLMPFRGDGS